MSEKDNQNKFSKKHVMGILADVTGIWQNFVNFIENFFRIAKKIIRKKFVGISTKFIEIPENYCGKFDDVFVRILPKICVL